MSEAVHAGETVGGAGAFGDLIAEADRQRAGGRAGARGPRRAMTVADLRTLLRDRLWSTGPKRKRTSIVAAALALALGGGAFWLWGPMSRPDYQKDNIRRVMSYTLLTDRFNQLPVEERLKLIGQLVQRFKGMSSSESALLASFAAGIAGKARQQVEENASRLMIDVWDKYASEYAKVGQGDRGAFLDKTIVDMQKMMEGLGGTPRDISDEQRLSEMKQQAQNDQKRMGQQGGMPTQAMGRMMEVMRSNIGSHASPAQRARGLAMMGDMVKHLRGQDGGN